MTESPIIKYIPHQTLINPSFWYKFAQVKLNIYKLSEDRKHIWAWFTNVKQDHNAPILEIDCTSFNSEFNGHNNFLPVHGYILNKNTVEQFKDINKLELLDNEGLNIIKQFKSGSILDDPSLLNTFFMLSFADLKKYHFYFWIAFPTLSGFNVTQNDTPKVITEIFNEDQISNLMTAYSSLNDNNQKSFFIVQKDSDNKMNVLTLRSAIDLINQDTNLSNNEELYFGFTDPSSSDSHPGWPMRNYMAFLLYTCPHLQGKIINVLSMRLEKQPNGHTCAPSIIFNIKFPEMEDVEQTLFKRPENEQSTWIGWQKNRQGKFCPKMVDMSSSMDPIKLAESSVDLNLQLMKWRLLPDIDLDKIKNTKWLLLGSGTLGCAVARNLLAWGVQQISFVDNGKVSFSNPVRQSLFTHEDCLNGGKMKAAAAADNLKKIFPSVISKGYQMTIPMPGHPVGDSLLEETKQNVDLLTELISTHDVIFLLMDSRESRWLPTVLATHFKKIVINAALGFETYLVMRHGVNLDPKNVSEVAGLPEGVRAIMGNELGCYFCNDITAPGNSMKDRTLDQQCTVTRPGISPIAGSLAVELAISILQHKDGPLARAFYSASNNNFDPDVGNECLLGIVPHSVRGFLSNYSQVLPATRRFQKCIACSDIIVEEYRRLGFEFLLNVFNSCKHLEDVTGLTELYKETDKAEIWEIDSSDEAEDMQ